MVYLLSAFSPNGDGNNDLFYQQGPTLARIAYFYVFDHWSNLCYATENGDLDDPILARNGRVNG